MKDRIAVLKLAGFQFRKSYGSWDWFVWKSDGKEYQFASADSFDRKNQAVDSAWRFIQGDTTEEMDGDSWTTTHQNKE